MESSEEKQINDFFSMPATKKNKKIDKDIVNKSNAVTQQDGVINACKEIETNRPVSEKEAYINNLMQKVLTELKTSFDYKDECYLEHINLYAIQVKREDEQWKTWPERESKQIMRMIDNSEFGKFTRKHVK